MNKNMVGLETQHLGHKLWMPKETVSLEDNNSVTFARVYFSEASKIYQHGGENMLSKMLSIFIGKLQF